MKECKYCGSTYADSLSACPNCGGSKIVTAEEKVAEEKLYVKEVQNQERSVSVPVETEKKRIPGFIIALGVVAAIIAIIIAISAGGGVGNSGGGNNPGNQTPQVDAAFEAGQKYYNTGNYEAAIRELSDVSVDSEHYENAQTMLSDAVEKYRTATLDRVSTYTNNGEYETALSLLVEAQSVLPDDTALKATYDSAYTAYVDSVIAKADSYSQAADYETAVGILNTAKNKYPQDTRLEASYVATYVSYKKQLCENAISGADSYAADGDYAKAISTMDEAIDKVGDDEALIAKKQVYVAAYKKNLLVKARDAYYSKGYEVAIMLLEESQVVIGKDEEISKAIKEYNDCKPVHISELHNIVSEESGEKEWDVDEWWIENRNYKLAYLSGNSYITHDLDGDYKYISGVFMFDTDSGWRDADDYSPTLRFYADDVLIATYSVSEHNPIVKIELDITGTKHLRIEADYMYLYDGWLYNHIIGGVDNFNFYKNRII